MPGRLEFEFSTSTRPSSAMRPHADAPMRILICADFSGREGRGLDDPATVATRPILRVDLDNLDDQFARLAPSVELTTNGQTSTIAFGGLDDFHPDSLFERLDSFEHTRDLRRRLLDPTSYAQASAELLGIGDRQESASQPESDADTMQRLLGRSAPLPAPTPQAGTAAATVNALLRQVVAADIVPNTEPQLAQLVSVVDTTIAEQMRALLHHPHFQALEASWRAVQFLITRLEFDEDLQLYLFDATRAELDAAAAAPEIQRSGLWQALVERPKDSDAGDGWSMVVAFETFGPSSADVTLLASLATVAAASGAPLIAGAAPSLFDCDTLPMHPDHHDWQPLDADSQQRWQALRGSALAPWIGLVALRMLLRLPYGKATDPLERFEFEELSGAAPAQALLWGHPAAACALLAGRAFRESGWRMDLDRQLDVENLPAWVYTEDGERRMYPCAEAWLGEGASQALIDCGIMPLVSRRDRPAARLMRWKSIAEPATALAGPWGD